MLVEKCTHVHLHSFIHCFSLQYSLNEFIQHSTFKISIHSLFNFHYSIFILFVHLLMRNPILYLFIILTSCLTQLEAQNNSFQKMSYPYIADQHFSLKSFNSQQVIPQSKTGYFCRFEWKLEKYTNIPFRFRLGSVDKIERLEGKRKDWLQP
jgi:hypothetical protein